MKPGAIKTNYVSVPRNGSTGKALERLNDLVVGEVDALLQTSVEPGYVLRFRIDEDPVIRPSNGRIEIGRRMNLGVYPVGQGNPLEAMEAIENMLEIAARIYDVEVDEIKSSSRKKEFANARHSVLFLADRWFGRDLRASEIAGYVGRERTSINHAREKLEAFNPGIYDKKKVIGVLRDIKNRLEGHVENKEKAPVLRLVANE